jgi:transketolase
MIHLAILDTAVRPLLLNRYREESPIMNEHMRRLLDEDWDEEWDEAPKRETKPAKKPITQARRQASKEFGKAIAKMQRSQAKLQGSNRKP